MDLDFDGAIFQRQGIGRALLIRVIAHAKRLTKARILLLCRSELIPYYQSVGFVHRGASASNHGGLVWHEMALRLGE